jgi:hypothetical protein
MEEQGKFSKFKNFISRYKLWVIFFVVLIITLYIISQNLSIGGTSYRSKSYSEYMGLPAPQTTFEIASSKPSISLPQFSLPFPRLQAPGQSSVPQEQPSLVAEHRIKEGEMRIKSQNADEDYKKIKDTLNSYKGNLEKYEKLEDDYKVTIYLNLKIPQKTFDAFVDYLNRNFKVVGSNVRLYVVSLKKTYDEIEILKKTFDSLSGYEERLAGTYPSRDNIELLMYINEKKMNILREMKNYEREIEETTTAENYNKLSIVLEQSKKIKIVDEEWSNRLREKLKVTLQNTIDGLFAFLNIIPFVISVVLYLVYAIVIVLALSILYKFFLIIKRLLHF